jgi:hypothetical protein
MNYPIDVSAKIYRTHMLQRIYSLFWFGAMNLYSCLFTFQFVDGAIVILNEPASVKISYLMQSAFLFFNLGIFVLIGLLQFGEFNYTSLIVTGEGLTYRNLFFTIEAEWEDVTEIYRPLYGSLRISLIDADHDEWLKLSHSQSQSLFGPIVWFIKLSQISYRIPISRFAWNWRSSELGTRIFTHARNLRNDQENRLDN